MPARKSNPKMLPHRLAVDLAPDSPDKRAVVETANARFLLLNGDITEQNLVLLAQLQQNAAQMLAEPMHPDQSLKLMAFSLRLAAQANRLRNETHRIREEAYAFARILHFNQTGVRVGDLFNPIEQQAAADIDTSRVSDSANEGAVPALQPEAKRKGEQRAPSTASGQASERPEAGKEARSVSERSTATPAKASNKQIKASVRALKEADVNAQRREQFRKQAQAEAWPTERLQEELQELLAA